MNSDYTWGKASGKGNQSCHLIAYRSPTGMPFDPTLGESWIIENRGGTLQSH